MPISKAIAFIVLLFSIFVVPVYAQYPASQAFKTLNVADGLPQSFISGLVQDSTGFIWIATRDGLARYDGKKFKVFMHKPGDTATLINNTISSLYLDKSNLLWIVYETGDIDVLNTSTENILHFSKQLAYKAVFAEVKTGHSLAEDAAGNMWFLCNNGGVFIGNLSKKSLQFYSDAALGLQGNKITGITSYKGNIVLVTDQALFTINTDRKMLQKNVYNFPGPHLFNPAKQWKDTYALFRKNGEIVIQDDNRLIVYLPASKSFKVVQLPGEKNMLNYNIIQDENGQVLAAYGTDIYILSAKNELSIWKPKAEITGFGFKSILIDRSGVLWLGGNGSGIQLHDLKPLGLTAIQYKKGFQEDILTRFLQIPESEINSNFLKNINAYYFRWFTGRNNKIWFSKSSSATSVSPAICYYSDGHIVQPSWYYSNKSDTNHTNISALALSRSGKLWGIDFYMRPVYFDTLTLAATVYAPLASINLANTFSANSLIIDGEDSFWVSTASDGLYFYNKKTKATVHYTAEEVSGSLPTNQLMNLVQDPKDKDILWIGSLGGGLVKFNKTTGKCYSFTINEGLPNNTVYAVETDAKGLLWCSSNRGIFSFDRTDNTVRSFTSKDGLPCDEFNRYHFFKFTDGQLAFGGVSGYTVFNPLHIADDKFQPQVALTGISINNIPVDYGSASSPFNKAINSVDKIVLPYNQNFLSFEMAALQYNITEKLKFRYMLEGFDKTWVHSGSNSIAPYTNIPPGTYILKINATNTAGKWSRHIKTLKVIIRPPFWQTEWFVGLTILSVIIVIYFLINRRIKGVRKEEQQKAEFEKEAAELKAQALRAQMNPHFIFNCLNSIKSLIQDGSNQQAIIYLTFFSKLIRSQLNNVQQEVSLHAELETCRLYVQLEELRFGDNIICEFKIEGGIDLFSQQVPPLILQPFIENAIWHGILPKNGGRVIVSVTQQADAIVCEIEDNGIGREMAMRNKSLASSTYESKGMKLVQNRFNLYNTINQQRGSIEVIDKKDSHGNAGGTLVIIKFKQEV